MRQQRNAVLSTVRRSSASAVAKHLRDAHLLRRGQRIAVYAAFDGEIDLRDVVRHAKRIGCVVCAPRIVNMRARKMDFIELPAGIGVLGNWSASRRSILEPNRNLQRRVDARSLDIVLVPVIAFDARGWRLGFGGGFYDRKFAFRRYRRRKPVLIGVAYEFQRVSNQIPAQWDVLLDAVVTERGLHRAGNRRC